MLPQSTKYQIRKLITELYEEGRRSTADCPYDAAETKLRDYEIENVAGLLLLDVKKHDAYDFINEQDKDCYLPMLVARYLISNDKIYAEEILNLLKTNAVAYFKTEIEQLLEDEDFKNKYVNPKPSDIAGRDTHYL
jgi:hypothetical protein